MKNLVDYILVLFKMLSMLKLFMLIPVLLYSFHDSNRVVFTDLML